MIVKDGAATLGRSLQSISAIADRILVGDTGSTDRTAEVATKAGAEVVWIPWEQDFSQARNRLLGMSRCEWILSIDADEMLDDTGPERIARLIARPEAEAYDVVRWNYVRSTTMRSGESPPISNPGLLPAARFFPAYTVTVNTRLFRRRRGVHFVYPVHETVAPCLDALGLHRERADFILHHLGQAEDTEETRQRKNELYHQLGLKKIESEPASAIGWFEVGLSELEYHRLPATALSYFEKALALDPNDARSSLFCGICLTALGRLSEASTHLQQAYHLGLHSAVLFEAVGDVYFHSGNYTQAREAYRRGSSSPLNQAKLGACEALTENVEKGLARIREAIRCCPEFAELNDILKATLLLAAHPQQASHTAADPS